MKKKLLCVFAIGFLTLFIFMPGVFAATDFTCEAFGGDIRIDNKLADIVALIILIIQIAIPIILVIFGMLDFAKALMQQKEDDIKKGQQTFIKRVIAAILVFFVIAIVKLVISVAAGGETGIMECANCFLSGSEHCQDATGNPSGNGGS